MIASLLIGRTGLGQVNQARHAENEKPVPTKLGVCSFIYPNQKKQKFEEIEA